jgi:phage putative head morphogenesis protein, SPP1 gp7 family
MAKWLHKQKDFKPEMLSQAKPAALIKQTFNALQTPLKQCLIKREIPEEFTKHLEEDIFIFSGFKTYHEINEASRLLKGDDGVFKSFEKFAQDIAGINSKYNRQYLNAEYNFATSSVLMAVKWKDAEENADRNDLQYRTANDGLVREEHAALHNTTLPFDDPFWDSYYPPNGWNCRCTAVEVRKGKYPLSDSEAAQAAGEKATTHISKDGSNKSAIFRFNPGKTEKVFPPKHPYLPKGCGKCDKSLRLSYNPNSEQCRACLNVAKCLNNKEKNKNE